jgi:hypothetical protein
MLSSSGHSCLVLALEIRLRQLQVHRVISGLHARVTLPWNTYQASYVVAVQGRFHVNLQHWNMYQAPYVVAVKGRFHVNLQHWNMYQAPYVVAVKGRFHVNLQHWNTYQASYVVAVKGRFHVNLHHHPRAIIAPRTWAGGPAGEPPASSHLRMQS